MPSTCSIPTLSFNILTVSFSNVDAAFRKYEHLLFPSKTLYTDGISAGVMVCITLKFPVRVNLNLLSYSRRSVSDKWAAQCLLFILGMSSVQLSPHSTRRTRCETARGHCLVTRP